MMSYYLAKILHKMRLSSFNHCSIDKTAKVDAECSLAKVTMGRYSYIGSGTRITDTVIGGFCSIGARCGIGGGVHPTDMVSTSPVFLKGHNILGKHFAEIPYEPSKTVTIGNDVWIGEGVFIVSGVKIGDGAIIGAHAVVTSDVDPYTVVAGVPAKTIRKRFDNEVVVKLQEIKWWDWPVEKIEKFGEFFSSPELLVNVFENNN